MGGLDARDLTLGELAGYLGRSRPFLLALTGVVLVTVVHPAVHRGRRAGVSSPAVAPLTRTATADGVPASGGVLPAAAPVVAPGVARQAAPTGVPRAGVPVRPTAPVVQAPSDCDQDTGRIKLYSFYAPNCVPTWPRGAANGGATWRGVSGDAITVAVYVPSRSEQVKAVITAAGGPPTSPEEEAANRDKVMEAFQAHFETYGRRVRWAAVQGSGNELDETAAKADAIKVATEVKAFVSFGGPGRTEAYAQELAARGVLCFCGIVGMPEESYLAYAPHAWSTLPASSQNYVHAAEYVGRRIWGLVARWAGDPAFRVAKRRLGLVHLEPDKLGADLFERELAKYGAKLTARIAYVADVNTAQEQSRVIAAKLKDAGITTVIFSGGSLGPTFFTPESTRQQYFPEYILTGTELTDTAFFARTYDPAQWSHAFGVSFLPARVDPAAVDREGNLVTWHCGCALTSYPNAIDFNMLFTGVQLAGAVLTPQTFRDGMFSFKPVAGHVTRVAMSYGRGLWPWDDYTSIDDTTEIWWDSQAQGPDELGNPGVGMYRYVSMGRRYLPGQWPSTEPAAFDPAGTTVLYAERPDHDRLPAYGHKHYRSGSG